MMKRNKKVVISGSPGAGKTIIIDELRNKGYSTFEEFSRNLIIDSQAQGIDSFFLSDPMKFSKQILDGRVKQFKDSEKFLQAKNEVVFYDRGIHDIYAYIKAIGQDDLALKNKVYSFQYDLVFLFSPWKEIFKKDNERLESFKQAQMYYPYIKKVYSKHHKVIEVPQASIEERISFIESFIKNYG